MANLAYRDYDQLLKNNYYFASSSTAASNPTHLPPSHTGIADSSASGIYFASNAPVPNLDPLAPVIGVRVANGLPVTSVASATLTSTPSIPPSCCNAGACDALLPPHPNRLGAICRPRLQDRVHCVSHSSKWPQHPRSSKDGVNTMARLRQFPLKPSLSLATLSEKHVETGPLGSADNFFNLSSARKQKNVSSRKQKKVSWSPRPPVPGVTQPLPATKPNLSMAALSETYEKPSPRGSAVVFNQPLDSTINSIINPYLHLGRNKTYPSVGFLT